MTIGQKIKARRTQLGYTQAHVAGDFISRNMLSLIENDMASPSLETLRYLSDKLEIPAEYLISEIDSPFAFMKMKHEKKILDLFHNKQYEESLKLIENLGQTDDSLARLAAECAYRIARQKLSGGSLSTARQMLEMAFSYIEKTSYDTGILKAKCSLALSIAQNIQLPKLNFNEEEYVRLLKDETEEEFYRYYCGELDYPYQNIIFSLHMQAKIEMKKRSYVKAIELLCRAEDEKTPQNYDAFAFLGIYTDLEAAYKEIGDFEKAYRYASKRISMMEYFKS